MESDCPPALRESSAVHPATPLKQFAFALLPPRSSLLGLAHGHGFQRLRCAYSSICAECACHCPFRAQLDAAHLCAMSSAVL